MKRFWEDATVEAGEGGYAILLDGKPVHLPGGRLLRVGPEALSRAIAEEWRTAGGGKGGEMSFNDTPLTRIAGTAQERIAPDPAPVVDAVARYGESDLLCYRAGHPEALVRRQAEGWQPWLDWAAARYRAPLRITTGVTPVRQHKDSIAALRQAVAALDVHALAGLGVAVPALGSLVLGLALAEGRLDAATAHVLGSLDEIFQAELWGEDAVAAGRRRAVADDIALAARYIALSRGETP